MFRMGFGSNCDGSGRFAAGGRGGRGGWGGRQGWGGGGRGRDDDTMRPGRMLGQGDLKLIALALIADEPRHGYDIIKALEDMTTGWYAPSPGIVYPTLTYLEEAGYATGEMDGTKKRYAITAEGRAYLDDNRAFADAVLARLAAVGAKLARVNRGFETDARRPRLPQLVDAAVDNLRSATEETLATDADAEPRIVEILARAAAEIRRG